jgi:hypothetical protein
MAFPLTGQALADVIHQAHYGGYLRHQFDDVPDADAFFFAHGYNIGNSSTPQVGCRLTEIIIRYNLSVAKGAKLPVDGN